MTLGSDVADGDLERFLQPLLSAWNGMRPEDLRGMNAVALGLDPAVAVSYVGEERSPFGYEYVEMAFRKAGAFEIRLRIEGTVGTLSTATHHPVVIAQGDVARAQTWLAAATAAS